LLILFIYLIYLINLDLIFILRLNYLFIDLFIHSFTLIFEFILFYSELLVHRTSCMDQRTPTALACFRCTWFTGRNALCGALCCSLWVP
jgi:hypothetical protein